MPDNPRHPRHPSDIHSSGPSDMNSQAGMQQSNPQPIHHYSAPPPNHQTRNIILGAIATVITSTIIYYLTVYQNSNKGDTRLQIKEATIEGWKSYKAYENAYYANLISIQNSVNDVSNLEPYLQEAKVESAKFVKDLTGLSKTKNLDKDLVNAFDRRLENEKGHMVKTDEYFGNIKTVMQSGKSLKELKQMLVAEDIRWNRYYKGAFERATNEVQEVAKTLSERYGQSFSMNDFLVVQQQPARQRAVDSVIQVLSNIEIDDNGNIVQTNYAVNLTSKDMEGTWNVDGDVVKLNKSSSLDWTMQEGGKATGTWKIHENQLVNRSACRGVRRKTKLQF